MPDWSWQDKPPQEKLARRKRGHIPWKTKFAAAIAQILEIPYDHQLLMDEEMLISLIDVHHDPEPHAPPFYGSDEFYNLDIIGIMAHRKETAEKTVPTIAKIKRGLTKREQKKQEREAKTAAYITKSMNALFDMVKNDDVHLTTHPFKKPKPIRQWPKGRKIQSRGFPKKGEKNA